MCGAGCCARPPRLDGLHQGSCQRDRPVVPRMGRRPLLHVFHNKLPARLGVPPHHHSFLPHPTNGRWSCGTARWTAPARSLSDTSSACPRVRSIEAGLPTGRAANLGEAGLPRQQGCRALHGSHCMAQRLTAAEMCSLLQSGMRAICAFGQSLHLPLFKLHTGGHHLAHAPPPPTCYPVQSRPGCGTPSLRCRAAAMWARRAPATSGRLKSWERTPTM